MKPKPDISEREREQYDALRDEVERIMEDESVRYLEEEEECESNSL